ncbi:hypothetical protein AKJ18_18350 [Vibrio xuii]|nr:hypothetical protein AKJ18_18350 [Vibrio xuii]
MSFSHMVYLSLFLSGCIVYVLLAVSFASAEYIEPQSFKLNTTDNRVIEISCPVVPEHYGFFDYITLRRSCVLVSLGDQ